MKNLNSKLFQNNTITKNKMAKVQGGEIQTTMEGRRDIEITDDKGELIVVLDPLPEVVIHG